MYGFGEEERTTERPRTRRQQRYGGYSRDNGRKIPPEYAVDVEYEEVEVIADGRKTYSSSEKSVRVESQVSDADWEEVK